MCMCVCGYLDLRKLWFERERGAGEKDTDRDARSGVIVTLAGGT